MMANGSRCQEIGALKRAKNAITHPVSQIPGYATEGIYTTPQIFRVWVIHTGNFCLVWYIHAFISLLLNGSWHLSHHSQHSTMSQ